MEPLAPEESEHRLWLTSLVEPLADGEALVDLGCGRGADLAALAGLSSHPSNTFVGLDHSAERLLVARTVLGNEPRIRLVEGDLEKPFPFADHSFDVAYSNNVLECVRDHPGFLNEVARIVRPGGRVVLAHWDWDTQVLNSANRDLLRHAIHAYADWQQPWMSHCDGWMGRRLWGIFAKNAAFEGRIVTRTLCSTDFSTSGYGRARLAEFEHLVETGELAQEQFDELWREQQMLAGNGQFFYSINCYAYVGQRVPLDRRGGANEK